MINEVAAYHSDVLNHPPQVPTDGCGCKSCIPSIEAIERMKALGIRRRTPNANRNYRKSISKAKRLRIFERDGWKCHICFGTEDLTLHHIIPIARGGISVDTNLVTLCFACHRIAEGNGHG